MNHCVRRIFSSINSSLYLPWKPSNEIAESNWILNWINSVTGKTVVTFLNRYGGKIFSRFICFTYTLLLLTFYSLSSLNFALLKQLIHILFYAVIWMNQPINRLRYWRTALKLIVGGGDNVNNWYFPKISILNKLC